MRLSKTEKRRPKREARERSPESLFWLKREKTLEKLKDPMLKKEDKTSATGGEGPVRSGEGRWVPIMEENRWNPSPRPESGT